MCVHLRQIVCITWFLGSAFALVNRWTSAVKSQPKQSSGCTDTHQLVLHMKSRCRAWESKSLVIISVLSTWNLYGKAQTLRHKFSRNLLIVLGLKMSQLLRFLQGNRNSDWQEIVRISVNYSDRQRTWWMLADSPTNSFTHTGSHTGQDPHQTLHVQKHWWWEFLKHVIVSNISRQRKQFLKTNALRGAPVT